MSVSISPSSLNKNTRTGNPAEAMAGTQAHTTGQSAPLQAKNQVQLSAHAVKLARLFDLIGQSSGVAPSAHADQSSTGASPTMTVGAETDQPTDNTETTQALQKLLSKSGQANGDNKYAYIEDSGLPESVQRVLKHIRDLKEQIREKMAEISKIQNDLTLDEKTRHTKLAKAQTELGILIAALAKTSDTLVQITRELKADGTLSEDDVKMAGQLAVI